MGTQPRLAHVEMQIDNVATPDEAIAYMQSPELDADPVGPAFA